MQLSDSNAFLPMTRAEMDARGWDEVDVVFVTGDAYVDHPSFATALLGRVLEAEGFKVAILAQPDWHSADAWTTFGKPRLCFCISAGNMDSMINHYTAGRKVRNEDAYSPGGVIGFRPDRATLSYCQRAREAYPGTPVITGGVEASLRRLVHYDYWSDKVKRSILMDSKADMLVYGMGETPLVELVRGLNEGKTVNELRDIRGTVYRIGASEDLPEEDEKTIHLPSCEEVVENKKKFVEMTKIAYQNLNPYNAARLVQEHLHEAIIVNPPSLPLTEDALDRIYSLPFTRLPHPSYGEAEIPAYDVIKNSVQILRGCFGGCTFCSLAAHQGKIVQSRSEKSICEEIVKITDQSDFKGTISDLGGPSANMYKLGCTDPNAKESCRKISCLCPEVCPNLATDQGALIQLMRRAREVPKVKQVYVASGVRTDLAQLDPSYIEELVKYHVGGHLKTAPEHTNSNTLDLMNKPHIENYTNFCEIFSRYSLENGKEQYLVPYFIAGFPGSTLAGMIDAAVFLHKNGIRPQQVQEFIPGPFELATCMYYTGIDPLTENSVYVARGLRERRLQKSLLLYHDPEYYHDVKTALLEAGRNDLIGNTPECLIPPYPAKMRTLKQSSKLKRLAKKSEAEKRQNEERRDYYAQLDRDKTRGNNRDRGNQNRGFGNKNNSGGSERRPFGENRDRNRDERRPYGENRDRNRDERRPYGENRDRNRDERRPFGENRDRNRDERRPFGENRDRNRDERGPVERRDSKYSKPKQGNAEHGRFKQKPKSGPKHKRTDKRRFGKG